MAIKSGTSRIVSRTSPDPFRDPKSGKAGGAALIGDMSGGSSVDPMVSNGRRSTSDELEDLDFGNFDLLEYPETHLFEKNSQFLYLILIF